MKPLCGVPDLIEATELPAFQEQLIFGPPLVGVDDLFAYADAATSFANHLQGNICKDAFRSWLDLVSTSCGIPAYDSQVLRQLSEFARNVSVRERQPMTREVRYRYVGQNLTDRIGRELTGSLVNEFNGITEAESWSMMRPQFEEGRPACGVSNYVQLMKRHIRTTFVSLPFCDRDSGQVRFLLQAIAYRDLGPSPIV